MSSAQRVRSALFFSVRVGTGKVFHPRVLEYAKSVRVLPHTVAIHAMCSLDAMIDSSQIGSSYRAKLWLLTTPLASIIPTGRNWRFSDVIFGRMIVCR